MKLKNKVALVTGAAGGIGLATAQRFAREGAQVVLTDLNEQALIEATESIGADRGSYRVVDVTDPQQMQAAVSETVAKYGGLDIFVANAGIEGPIKSIEDCPVEDFDKVLAVNVRAVWLGLKYAIPAMRERGGGSIIITSSGAGVQGMANMSPYNTSKHATIGIMRCAAKECASLNIRINTVNPGPVETGMMRAIESGMDRDHLDEVKAAITAGVPMGRYARPEEVANMMLFLASDEGSYCTGGVYMVDGGNST